MPGQIPNAEPDVKPPYFPQHFFASPSSTVDMNAVKPHACMENVRQRGNYIHCMNGNHGMRIPPGKVLTKDGHGNFQLEDVVIRDETGEIVKP